MIRTALAALAAATLALAAPASIAQDGEDALLPVSYNAEAGKLLLEIDDLEARYIYTTTLASGLGTTEPLLDRGQLGESAIVRFERRGSRVLLIRENAAHRALTENAALRRSVTESFPESVLASMPIEDDSGAELIVDATDFVLSDVFGAGAAIKQAGLGEEVKLDQKRSYVDPERLGAFPKNSEIASVLTFEVTKPNETLARHAPDPRAVTLAQQHSFMALPEAGYEPRRFHPRAGLFPHVIFDFAQGFETDYRRRWIWRWRLVPSDKQAYLDGELVEPEEPIVYYLDPGIPEPYRSAFREGGMWYNELFEAAGFKNAFQIKELPEDANPMDARYNVIEWVHRRKRGPSIGPSYRDPRTGEILRTVVRMDSYRSLVNHDIWMGFRPAAGDDGLSLTSEEMAMGRRRQHAAHEIGHTLGLAHNFIAASQNRASVMDYPVPLVRLDEAGNLDISEAYKPGPGAYDEIAIRYAYTWYPDGEAEREGLEEIMADAREQGLRFITGGDAAPSGAFPAATQWVEGSTMLEALDRTMAVRERLIAEFDDRALEPGEPVWYLNKRFAYVYFHHRTALKGAIKHLGGREFAYALAGEAAEASRPVSAEAQRTALNKVLTALRPAQLRMPAELVGAIPPTPFGWEDGWQWSGQDPLIRTNAGDAPNPLYLAHSLAQEIADTILHPERANRMAAQRAQDRTMPGLDGVLQRLIAATWGRAPDAVNAGEQGPVLLRIAQRAVLDALLDLAGDAATGTAARTAAEAHLQRLKTRLGESGWAFWRDEPDPLTAAHRDMAVRDIQRYFDGEDDPEDRPRPEPMPLPWP